jgi:hypothetical protein
VVHSYNNSLGPPYTEGDALPKSGCQKLQAVMYASEISCFSNNFLQCT